MTRTKIITFIIAIAFMVIPALVMAQDAQQPSVASWETGLSGSDLGVKAPVTGAGYQQPGGAAADGAKTGLKGVGVPAATNTLDSQLSSASYSAAQTVKNILRFPDPTALNITNWESSPRVIPAVTSTLSADYVESEVCGKLFSSDPNNIFRTVFCSLIRIASLSVADFASNITCTIQAVGMPNNYYKDITFGKNDYVCAVGSVATSASPTRSTIFGSRTGGTGNSGDGFYGSNTASSLSDNIIAPGGAKSTTQDAFDLTKNIVSIVALIALLVFAFANILHIEINTYAIKKALPALLIAIVGAWLAIYVVYLLSRGADSMYQISWFSPYQVLHPMQNILGAHFSVPVTTGAVSNDPTVLNRSVKLIYDIGGLLVPNNSVSFFGGILGTIILIVPAIAVFALEYMLALRPFAVQLLTIISPIAFACLILPQTQKFFRLWWSFLLVAIFYAPLVNFAFFVMNSIAGPTAYSDNNGIAAVAIIMFKTAVVFFLVRLPFAFEGDFRKISAKISVTSLGSSLGLSRAGGQDQKDKQKQQSPTVADHILASQEARSIIASTSPNSARINLRNVFTNKRSGHAPTDPYLVRNIFPQLPKMLENAHLANLERTAPLIAKSVTDLSPDVFKAVLNQSDHKIWRNSGIIQALKNQNGQVLDNQGAALRADGARKLVRLAQVVENGKVANPDAIKLMAQKGSLSNLPMSAVKIALDQGVLEKSDLFPTYKNQSTQVFDRLGALNQTAGTTNLTNAKILMQQDRKDFESGFKDVTKMFFDSVRDPKVMPPPSAQTIKQIFNQVKDTDNNIFDKNGMYFMKRLSDVGQNSAKTISSTLQKEGVNPQTASAIANNPRIDFDSAKKYITQNAKPDSIAYLREGFINRDLSTELSKEISSSMVQQKTAIGQTISQKISDSLKADSTNNLAKIKTTLDEANKKLASPTTVSADDFKKAVAQIEKFYPGSNLKTDGQMNPDDIADVAQRAKSVNEVVEALQKNGIDEKTLSDNPKKAVRAISSQIQQDIAQTLAENTALGAKFTKELENSATKPPQISPKEA